MHCTKDPFQIESAIDCTEIVETKVLIAKNLSPVKRLFQSTFNSLLQLSQAHCKYLYVNLKQIIELMYPLYQNPRSYKIHALI